MSIQDKADEFIYQSGLMEILQKYGTVSIVGSYKMEVMTWNDLDIYLDITEFGSDKYDNMVSELISFGLCKIKVEVSCRIQCARWRRSCLSDGIKY